MMLRYNMLMYTTSRHCCEIAKSFPASKLGGLMRRNQETMPRKTSLAWPAPFSHSISFNNIVVQSRLLLSKAYIISHI